MISRMARTAALLGTVLVATVTQTPAHAHAGVTVTPFSRTEHQVGAGAFTKIYDPSVGETTPWYINDHTIVRGADGTWHLFGITHEEPANPEDEDHLAHATAPSLHGPWTKRPFALSVDPGYDNETHLWAPYVLEHDGTYYMFYNGGGDDHSRYAISLATSTDLYHWTRRPDGPLFRDGYDARDPYVMRLGGRWVMYYTANSAPGGGNHIVAYRTSTDLVNWSDRQVAFTDPSAGTSGGPTESPFVVRHGGFWYLFIGPRPGYIGTDVFRSRDPLHFDVADKAGHIASHAAEVVRDGPTWYVTAAGWGQGGVYVAPLNWSQPTKTSGVTVEATGYRATVLSEPAAELTELSYRTADGGTRNLLENGGRGTRPYLGVGNFGSTDLPGPAARTAVTREGVTLSGVRLGDEPVTADWSFRFAPDSFETSLNWHVTSTTTAPVWEAGLGVDPVAARYGDDELLPRTGDVPGFPRWALASAGAGSLAMAYRQGSSWAEANHWFGTAGDGMFSWQPLWQPGGRSWTSGDYAGGTWHVGVSPQADDRDLAERLEQW
nr:hypothetical protein [Actinoallomurus sp. ID145808]